MAWYYIERDRSGLRVLVDEDEQKFAAVQSSVKYGPFDTLGDLHEHLTMRVRAVGGDGGRFHVYREVMPV